MGQIDSQVPESIHNVFGGDEMIRVEILFEPNLKGKIDISLYLRSDVCNVDNIVHHFLKNMELFLR